MRGNSEKMVFANIEIGDSVIYRRHSYPHEEGVLMVVRVSAKSFETENGMSFSRKDGKCSLKVDASCEPYDSRKAEETMMRNRRRSADLSVVRWFSDISNVRGLTDEQIVELTRMAGI